jgi:hypothetical protein
MSGTSAFLKRDLIIELNNNTQCFQYSSPNLTLKLVSVYSELFPQT